MSEKKPAHKVIVEMINETVGSLLESLNDTDPNCDKPEVEGTLVLMKLSILSVLMEVLKRMIIPQKEVEWVTTTILQARTKLPSDYAEKLLPEKNILAIAPPEQQ